MNKHTLKVLEFPQLLSQIQAHAMSDSGKSFIANLKPQITERQAFQMTDLYKSFLALRENDTELPLAEFHSPAVILNKLAPEGAVLDLLEVHVIRRLMKISDRVRKFLTRDSFNKNKAFQELASGLYNYFDILASFAELFDDKGDIRDTASPVLAELKPKVRAWEEKISNKLNKMLKNDDGTIFQDFIVTRRNNRFVVPVKRESKSKIQGIVHDESTSGRTLFLEPQSVVPLGNELVSTIKNIDHEVRKILRRVSSELRQLQSEIDSSFKTLTRYDVAFAVSAWANKYHCFFAEKNDSFNLINARHPILEEKLRQDQKAGRLVPLNFKLSSTRVLAITGSNTGGKTVTLKTLGLLALIFQTGLPIPAGAGSQMPFFSSIFADIGDEQSLQQSLSTFSGHMKNIGEILIKTEEQKSLVLLDELGSGTDPLEGGALGCAVIEELSKRDVTTILTTHLRMIKVFVHENQSMMNASVRFNIKTMEPEYVLDIGLPGASHAISIAQRLQLPESVISKARSLVSSDAIKLENVLEELDSKQRSLAVNMQKVKIDSEKMTLEREVLQKELSELRKKRRAILHEAQKEAESLVENARKKMEQLIKEILAKGALPEDVKRIREKIGQKRDKLRDSIKQTAAKPDSPVRGEDLLPGDLVWVEKLQDRGTVLTISKDFKKVQVEVAGMPFHVEISGLGKVLSSPVKKKAVKKKLVHVQHKRTAVSLELNIIGKRAEDALAEVDKYLDKAMAAGREKVRIIHGRGTGALRKALHSYLGQVSFVSKFACPEPSENSPGDSVTDVWL